MSSRPRESALVHTSVQPIRWGDMDALGHVNNTVWIELASGRPTPLPEAITAPLRALADAHRLAAT